VQAVIVTTAAPRCLLLVDDNPRNLIALDAILADSGHRLLHANDGEAALDIFEREAPDIVLCDLVMPKLSGLEVLLRIRAHPERGHTPVIIITSYAEREHRRQALRCGADEFLEKPIDEVILSARLNTLLLLKESRDELASRHAAVARLQEEQRELIAFIVQDLSAPITSLHGSVNWIENRLEEGLANARPVFTEMRAALDRVRETIEDLGWVSRLESSNNPLRRVHLSVNELVEEAVRRVELAAANRRIVIERESTEHVTSYVDAELLARVLDNLLDNALRYTADGGRIRMELRRDDGVEIRVCNDGRKIPLAERSRIFERFVRGAGETPSPGNPGLGLYFCKRAVGAHQGELRVLEVPGWATCFALWLPSSASARYSSPRAFHSS
jgi:signal transduction histidine kinase